MTTEDYLKNILANQMLESDSEEMKQLRSHRDDVERILRSAFSGTSPTIRYAGSVAKNTLIKESYDLDICCYFPNGENGAGTSLDEIFNNVSQALSPTYAIKQKTSAIRLSSNEADSKGQYFHIDVVPGRYTDDSKTDCYLHQNTGSKERLKTNLDVHIDFIKNSGVTDALKLLKLWRIRNGIQVKQFAFELMCIDLLKNKAGATLEDQLNHVWNSIADAPKIIKIEDPANPTGNDLMPILEHSWPELQSVATQTLQLLDEPGWDSILGTIEDLDKSNRISRLNVIASHVQQPTKPWRI